MRRRIPFAILCLALLGIAGCIGYALSKQVELAAEISQFRASIADIPRVETYDAGLGDWRFTVIKDPKDGHTIGYDLTGSDLPIPQYAVLPMPPERPLP